MNSFSEIEMSQLNIKEKETDQRSLKNITKTFQNAESFNSIKILENATQQQIYSENIQNNQSSENSYSSTKAKSKNSTVKKTEKYNNVKKTIKKNLNKQKQNLQQIPDYVDEIIQYTKKLQDKFMISIQYINEQNSSTDKLRQKTIDSLISIQEEQALKTDTIFLTINLMDRFLSQNKQNIQLVAITSLFIASKIEEIQKYIYNPPSLNTLITICNYSKQEILEMEAQILIFCNFSLTYTSPLQFLETFIIFCNTSKKNISIAKYLLELSLFNVSILKYQPSIIAASALYATSQMRGNSKFWNSEIEKKCQYNKQQLKPCVQLLIDQVWKDHFNKNTALYKKYSKEKYYKIANLDIKFK